MKHIEAQTDKPMMTIPDPKVLARVNDEVSAADHMNQRQRWALSRIISFFKDMTRSQPDVWWLSFTAELLDYGQWSVTVKLARTDCDEFSPRAVLCGDGGHFFIGKKGGVRVCNRYRVTKDRKGDLKHLAMMVRGTTY